MPTHEILKDSGIYNNLNTDNKIYLSKRLFTYSYKIYVNKVNNVCAVFLDQKCMEENGSNCIKWSLHKLNTKNVEYQIKKIGLYVYSTKSTTSLANSQTIIKYDYFNENGNIFFGERTGVLEDSSRIFLHQPRHHVFAITELNPFPEVQFPLIIGKEWKAICSIPPHTLETIKYDSLCKTKVISRDLTYKIVSKVKVKVPFGLVDAFKIEATAEGAIGKTNMTAYFNEKLGFIKIIYGNIDKSTIILNLDSIKDNIK